MNNFVFPLILSLFLVACGSDESSVSPQVKRAAGVWKSVDANEGESVFEVSNDGKVYQISPSMRSPNSNLVGTLEPKGDNLALIPTASADFPEGASVTWYLSKNEIQIKARGQVQTAKVARLTAGEYAAYQQTKSEVEKLLTGNWVMVDIERYFWENSRWVEQSEIEPAEMKESYEATLDQGGKTKLITIYNPKRLTFGNKTMIYNDGQFTTPLDVDYYLAEIEVASTAEEKQDLAFIQYRIRMDQSGGDRLVLEQEYFTHFSDSRVKTIRLFFYDRIE